MITKANRSKQKFEINRIIKCPPEVFLWRPGGWEQEMVTEGRYEEITDEERVKDETTIRNEARGLDCGAVRDSDDEADDGNRQAEKLSHVVCITFPSICCTCNNIIK